MIKLTELNGDNIWINPKHIYKMKDRYEFDSQKMVWLTTLISVTNNYLSVVETPAQVLELIKGEKC